MSQTSTITCSPSTAPVTLPHTYRQSTFRPLLAHFNYYLPPAQASAPSTNDLELILGTKDQDTRLLPVTDVRGREDEFDLANNGFCYIRGKFTEKVFADDARITDIGSGGYYGEIEALLRDKLPGITAIHHLGHIVRSAPKRTDFSPSAPTPTDPAWNKPDRGAAPAPRVHIDFTRRGVYFVLAQAFGERTASEITEESGRRFVAFSVWKPIKRVRRDPLGICDAASVRVAELVTLQRLYPDGRGGENIVVKATASAGMAGLGGGDGGGEMEGGGKEECQHKWYWLSEQTPEEVLVIKIFDSQDPALEDGGKVRVAPHASFHVDGTEEEEIRESIEVRVVVCF